MPFSSSKRTSKGSLVQGALGSGTLHLFHTLHLCPSLGNLSEPQALPLPWEASVPPSANARLRLLLIPEPSLGPGPPIARPHSSSVGLGLRQESHELNYSWVCPTLGLTENSDSCPYGQAPTAAHHPAGCLPRK